MAGFWKIATAQFYRMSLSGLNGLLLTFRDVVRICKNQAGLVGRVGRNPVRIGQLKKIIEDIGAVVVYRARAANASRLLPMRLSA